MSTALLSDTGDTVDMMSTPSQRFVCLSYNILCKSLGSNCIPWVMTVEDQMRRDVESSTGEAWNAWKQKVIFSPYRDHFHKNLATGDYITMRDLWSARRCRAQEDLPATLQPFLKVVAEDKVEYVNEHGEAIVATTLKGVLRSALPGALGDQLFEHLMQEEEHVFGWPVRGPRIFRQILQPTLPSTARPDIVILQEYDAHSAVADYRGTGTKESFQEAMAAKGFSGALFMDPMRERVPPAGLGVFWHSETFCLHGDDELPSELECGASVGGSVFNVDMLEHWHKDGGEHGPLDEQMPVSERRNVALVRLRHIQSNRVLWVVTAHLMTTSRDGVKTNEFPGEVRAGELRAIRTEVERRVPPAEAVVLAGDFNTNACNISEILGGNLSGVTTGLPMKVDTGLAEEEGQKAGGVGSKALRWHGSQGQEICLREAFEHVHQWGGTVGSNATEGNHCTSRNAERAEWIDYIWYDAAILRPTAVSDTLAPASSMPNQHHGSDHMPVATEFEFIHMI
eukprot:TRINITY_DN7700_c0_g4_i2.p1 TRINITY_DN7700_c0_g4~~TRINITY_DN7700_c0_g4_i2.p1  ORF type:complete len:555 (-),score=80.21 TRINITY_DN7700_c0_g4_i2:130-1659(-)